MPEPKIEHYVPEAYLRRFTKDSKSVFVYDKYQRRIFKTNISNVACEKGFYDFPKGKAAEMGIDPKLVEKTFSDIETTSSEVIERVINKIVSKGRRKKIITENQRLQLSIFIAFQLLRTPQHREILREVEEKLGEELLKELPDYSPENFIVKADEEWIKLFHSGIMFDEKMMNPIIKLLFGHIWMIGTNKTDQPLYTSDNPVVKRGHIDDPLISNLGLASKGIEIALPLNSDYIIIICERSAFREYENRDGKIISLNSENITYYNSMQVVNSNRQIYCINEKLQMADTICNTNPEICNPNRERIKVN